ncbi:MAG: ankyrin repeat domain-containing protein [Bacteroidetes bacterium]|nr:ankyrin repeat domain-containing protein [Bacteroidota bacterium]
MNPRSLKTGAILIVSWLFSAGSPAVTAQPVPPDTTNPSYRITKAVETGDIKAVKKLLATDPSLINVKEPGIDDPLLVWAARKNQPAMVSFLLKSGADIHALNRLGSNALHLAAFTGDYAMMELLMKSGADWNLRNQRGKVPVDYVSFGKNPHVFELFLEKDKNILQEKTPDGATLLHLAASAGDTAGFSFLLDHGLDIHAKDTRGVTVVIYAMDSNNPGMLDYLGRMGADLDTPENMGFTPLFIAVIMQNQGSVLYFTDRGADVNHRTNEGLTPFLMAAQADALPMLELLASKGADPLAANNEGKTALHLAVMNGSLSVATYLLGLNLPPDARDKNGMTPLHYAAIYGYASIGKALLEKGADPAITDNNKHDAAYYCEWYCNTKLCQLLVQKDGAKPEGKDPVKPLAGKLGKGEAVVHYLNHSGYAVETDRYLLVFDYFQPNPVPSTPSLLNGRINPAELGDKKIIVFVSHEHTDHYDTAIWEWRKARPDITYVMGFRPATAHPCDFIAPHEEKTIGDVSIHAIRSTDSGVGFLVEADGIVVYHPGDHANKTKVVGPEFKDEIDYLTGLKKKVDIAFFPVSGCSFPDLEAVKTGNYYVIGEMKPGICFSMHGDNASCSAYSCDITKTFSSQPSAFGTFPGDRFFYSSRQ